MHTTGQQGTNPSSQHADGMDDVREALVDTFVSQAEWRRGKAEEFPSDTRNLTAAEIFDQLAATVADIRDDDLLSSLEEILDDGDSFKEWNWTLSRVGFDTAYDNAEEFVADFVAVHKLLQAATTRRRESRLRRLARKYGMIIRKSRRVNWHLHDQGQYMLVNAEYGCATLGSDYDATLDEIEAYLTADEVIIKTPNGTLTVFA